MARSVLLCSGEKEKGKKKKKKKKKKKEKAKKRAARGFSIDGSLVCIQDLLTKWR